MTLIEKIGYSSILISSITGVIVTLQYRKGMSNFKKQKKSSLKNYFSENKETEIEANSIFNWDMPIDEDLTYEKHFIGLDIWEDEELAKIRIEEISNKLKDVNVHNINFNMFETYLISIRFGENIKIVSPGVFEINKGVIQLFIKTLKYDVDLISELNKFNKEHIENKKKKEINVETLFHLMKNAKALGMNNIKNDIHNFGIRYDTSKNNTIDLGVKENDNNLPEISSVRFEIVDNIIHIDKNQGEEVTQKDINNTIKLLEEYKKSVKFTESEDKKQQKYDFGNGKSLTKDDAWGKNMVFINPESEDNKDTKHNNPKVEQKVTEGIKEEEKSKHNNKSSDKSTNNVSIDMPSSQIRPNKNPNNSQNQNTNSGKTETQKDIRENKNPNNS